MATTNQTTGQAPNNNPFEEGLIYDSDGRGVQYTPNRAPAPSLGSDVFSNQTRSFQGGEEEPQIREEKVSPRERRGTRKMWMLIALAAFLIVLALVAGIVGAKVARHHDSKSTKSIALSSTTTSLSATPTSSPSVPVEENSNTPSIKTTSGSPTTTTSSATKTSTAIATPTLANGVEKLVLPTTGVLPNICTDSGDNRLNSSVSIVQTHAYPAQSNGYTSTFTLACNSDPLGINMAVTTAYTLEQCLETCNGFNALGIACKGVSWVANITTVIPLQGGNCYLKNATQPATPFAIASFGGPQIGAFLIEDSSSIPS